MIQVIIALLVIVAVARLILRGYKAEPVLLVAGLLLMFCTQLAGWGSVLPKGVATTGIAA
ncbi:MAG: C4-dicarboxylate transporter DcuC, partial [Edwardsiella piscicida]